MLKNIFYIILFLIFPHPAYADETADKAEFKTLYAQFKDLYANSEAIDPIIVVAEKLYKLVPEVYGKNSKTHGVITYNLASLYDEKGENSRSDDEKKAVELYKKYFKIQDILNIEKDKTYLNQYFNYIKAEHNINWFRSNFDLTDNYIEMAENSKMTNLEIADIEYEIALLKISVAKQKKTMPVLEKACKRYITEFGPDHMKVGLSLFWLAKLQNAKKKPFMQDMKLLLRRYKTPSLVTENNYLEALRIFEANGEIGKVSALTTRKALARFYYNQYQPDKAIKFHKTAITKEEIARAKEVKPLMRFAPEYPLFAIEQGFEGEVDLELTIDKLGKTKDIFAVKSSHIYFSSYAINAASRYLYEPTILNGEPIDVVGVKIKIQFKLK